MKMNFKTLMMAAFAMTVGFSSCSSDDENTIGGDEKSMFFKLSNGPSSYMEEAAVGDGTDVMFNDGHLYFTTASGVIVKHMTITDNASDAGNIKKSDATGGTTLSGIPGNAYKVVVVGNSSVPTAPTNISAVEEKLLEITTQTDYENVNLFGSAILAPKASTPMVFEAEVTLAPTVARIELSDITGTGKIESFEVTGIFIDNFEVEAQINGEIVSGGLSVPTQTPADYVGASTKYPTNYPFDYDTPLASSVSKTAKPSTGVWAYNVFQSTNVPRIIIRLENIVATGLTYTGPQFLTITGFKNAGADVTAFEGGKVYKIGAGVLKFDEDDLTPNPNTDEIDVEIIVKTVKWKVVDVTPVL